MKHLRDAVVSAALIVAVFNSAPAPLLWEPVYTLDQAVVQCADHFGPGTTNRADCISAARDAWKR